MKKTLIFSYLVMIISLGLTSRKVFCREIRETHMDTLYKQIGDQLVNIKKEYPACQSKIYVVLDQVDKMYNMAKIKGQQSDQLKETLKNKELENGALQNELVAVKTTLDTTHAKLETTMRNLEQEKKLVAKLSEEKNGDDHRQTKDSTTTQKQVSTELADFEAQVTKDQSLNLTSTSEPKSPR